MLGLLTARQLVGAVALAIIFKEAGDTADGLLEVILMRQENQTEMIWVRPIEARPLNQQDLFFLQQFTDELLIVLDRVNLRLKLREHVQRRLRLDAGHARDGRNQFMGDIALATHAAAFGDQVVDALVTAQGRLDTVLPGCIGAQAHRSQHVEAFDIVLGMALVTGNHHPASAIATGTVVLRQPVEGDGQDVVGQRRHRGVLDAVVQDLVVHLVGVNDQVMLAGDVDEFAQQIVRIQGARRIVRVDQDNRPGMGVDFAANVVQIGQPTLAFVAQVMLRRAPRQTDRRRPQRIIGCRHQDFIAGIEQGVHRHDDQLGDPVTNVDILQRHALDTFLLGIVHDRLARGKDTLRIRITGRIGQVADDVLLDFLGRIKAECGQVADVQLDDFVALFLHLLGFLQHRAANVVADVGEFGGLLDVVHENLPAWRLMTSKGQRYNPTLSHGAPQFRRTLRNVSAVKLHIPNTAGLNLFTAYGDDYAAVNQEKYSKNLILLPESIIHEWTAATLDTLSETDIQILLGLGTEIILLGTGKRLRFPPGALLRPFAPAGIGLEVMDLQAACRTYNILASEGRKVAAALLFDGAAPQAA